MLLTCFHLLLFQSIHYIKAQTLNNTNKSICITDTDEDINTISSVYNPIIYDPRFDPNENPPQLTCNNRTIWISQDSKYIIYYKIFTDTSISYKPPNTDIVDIPAFGIFECSKDSYLDVLQSQSLNIPSNNLCIDPATIYPDSYPGSQCISKPIVYCLPFIDETKCPQFQATMASMYNAVDLSKDLVNMHNFYDCNCWFKPNNGDTNNDERVDIDISFDKNCRQILEKMKAENDENIWQNQPHEKKDENPETEDMNINKNGFDILWIILSTLIGLIMFIIIALFLHRKQWHRKMYLSSRKYLRNWHRGDVENENLMQIDNGMIDDDEYNMIEINDKKNMSNIYFDGSEQGKTVIPNLGPKHDTDVDIMLTNMGNEYEEYSDVMYDNDIETYQDLLEFDKNMLKTFINNEKHLIGIMKKAEQLKLK